MINVSEEFRRLMRERTDFAAGAELTLPDGKVMTFTADDFTASGLTLTDGAGADGLPLGAAVCRTVQMEIINADGRLDGCDFFGAKVRLWLTFRLTESVERIELGTFTVDEPESWGETVTITAADDMIRADKTYTPGLSGEATLGELWRDVCTQCGISFATAEFPNSGFRVAAPAEEYTCRQMLGYIAMLAGGNARIDRTGTIRLLTYERGRAADHELTDWAALSTDTDDVVVTGLEAETDDGTVLEGEEGYVLTVDNPLMAGREAEALRRMGEALIGLTLRRFDGSHVGYPLAECMDTVRFRDRRGRWYNSVITDVTFACGACTDLSNSAESVVRNGSRYVSAETRARQQARKLVQQERSARQAVEEQLQKRLAEASGFYTTDVPQPDKSVIRYVHDKPTLEASMNVIKITAEAIGFSTDGGQTYPFGLTVDGKTIMGIIATEGLYADWMETGVLQSKADASGKRKFYLNLDTGDVDMEVRNLTIAGQSVNEALAGAVVSVEQQFYLSDSPTAVAGGSWSNTQPAWTAGRYIWSRQYVQYGDGTDAYLPSESGVCITGNTGANGANGKDGINGKDGENGVGVKSITNYYLAYASASGVTVDTAGWSINVQSVSAGKPYLWNYEVTAYTDGTSTTVAPHIVGTYGRDGTNGTNGTNGKGIRSITEHYLATSAASGVTTSTAGWTTSLQNTDTTKRYLWNYETITYTDGSTDTVAPRIIGTHGTNGKDGTNGEDGVGIESVEAEYILSPSDQSPTEDPAAKWSTTIPPAVEGMYIWTRQKITYTDGTVEYAGQYCMSRTMGDIAQQKVDAQTQEQIFDKLTNNGQLQGLFMQDGYLYINARYLRGDTIDLNMLKLAGTVCGLMQGTGMTGNGGKTTVGIVLYGNGSNEDGTAKPPYLIVTNEGIRLQLKDGWPEECVYFSNGHMQIVGEDLSTSGNIHTSNGSYGIGPDGGHPAITFEPDNFNLMAFGAPYVPGFVPRTWLRGYYVYVNEDDSGATYIRGSDIYASKSIQVNSDARLKKDIEPLPEACERMLDHLSPVAYRYKRETDDAPKHWGYTTQDVEAALRAAGLDRPDMAALGQYETEDGERYMALAYEELIAALHLKVKSLEARIEQIEEGTL